MAAAPAGIQPWAGRSAPVRAAAVRPLSAGRARGTAPVIGNPVAAGHGRRREGSGRRPIERGNSRRGARVSGPAALPPAALLRAARGRPGAGRRSTGGTQRLSPARPAGATSASAAASPPARACASASASRGGTGTGRSTLGRRRLYGTDDVTVQQPPPPSESEARGGRGLDPAARGASRKAQYQQPAARGRPRAAKREHGLHFPAPRGRLARLTLRALIGRRSWGAGRAHAVAAVLLREKERAEQPVRAWPGRTAGVGQEKRAGLGWVRQRGRAESPSSLGWARRCRVLRGGRCTGPSRRELGRGEAVRADRRGLTAPVVPPPQPLRRAMPSDLAKKKAAKKKEAAKARQRPRRAAEENGDGGMEPQEVRPPEANGMLVPEVDALTKELEDFELKKAAARAVTGVLASHPNSTDVHIINLSLTFHGQELLSDTKLELNSGRRYGLIGLNGIGKSMLLSAIGKREVPIPEHIDIYHLTREMPPSDKTPLQCVMEVDTERAMLEREAERLAHEDAECEKLLELYERLEELDADKAEARASRILHGLGFTPAMQRKKLKDFSGGWRMRVALARALFIRPFMLLLDEPTNHLDLDACVWLEEELKTFKRILVLISHSQDFLNGVCTNIIHMHNRKLKYYTGNYDQYVKTRLELEENQMKRFHWEQDQIAHMKNYIARFGHGSAKLARQAQSKEKTLQKMMASGLTERVVNDKTLSFYFPPCGKIPPPVIMVQNVSFKYTKDGPWIYNNLEFGIDLDTRVALVGPNGAGKSTLLKLLTGELLPTDGMIRKHSHVKIGRYHQHLQEQLDLDLSPLEYMLKCYPEIKEKEEMRKIIGRYGLTGKQQVSPIRNLSDGQKCRVCFAWLAWQNPHMLFLDEPTNHLDIETIDALADAINDFEGGMMLVSHDFRLIQQVAQEIWVCEKQTITKWQGDILAYKEHLKSKLVDEDPQLTKKTHNV